MTEETTTPSPVVEASTKAYGRLESDIRLAHTDSKARLAPGPVQPHSRERREEAIEALLSPGATRPKGAGNRAREEEPDIYRTCFERDLDRIKYSHPFRRLAGKCQVFLAPDDAHIRNRMTHAIEVSQVALSISNTLGLNSALVEAIALGHDCGHGPGGHASEDAFASFIDGGYDHAIYGADVVLTPLNLCAETLDGIRHHSWRLPAPLTPEGEVVSISDRLAYVAHDADDAVRAGIIRAEELPESVKEVLGTRQSAQIASLIDGVVTASSATGLIGIDQDVALALDDFRKFNYERIYLRPAASRQSKKVIDMLAALVEHFADAPGQIPSVSTGEWADVVSGSAEAYETSVRYVSGMTDHFAIATAMAIGMPPEQLPRGV